MKAIEPLPVGSARTPLAKRDRSAARLRGIVRRLRAVAAAALIGARVAGAAAAQPPALGASVDGLLAHARAQNPELAAMRLEADAALQRVVPAGALPDPVLRIELENVNNYGREAGANLLPARVEETKYTLMQPLPGWGKRDLRRDVAGADAEQASARANAAWAEVAMRIKTAYAQYYLAAGLQRSTQGILDVMSRLEQVAQARYAGGLVAQQDAIRAQVEQTAMRSELIALDNGKRQLRARLNALLGRDGAEPLDDPQALRPLPAVGALGAQELVQRTLARNPSLAAEDARLRAAQKGRELALRNRYPDFQLGVSPTQVRSRVTTWSVMLEMNIPLQQASRRAQESEAEAMVGAASSRKQALMNQLQGELAESLAGLDAAQRSEALLTTQLLPQSELGFRSALAGYETGKVDFAALLDAQLQVRKARQERLKAQVEAQLRLAEIERILGEDL